MDSRLQDVGRRVKELKDICEFTSQDVADELQISVEEYEEYERTGDFPIGVLFGLEKLFRVEFSELVTGNRAILNTYQVIRRGHGHPIERKDGAYRYKDLAYNFKGKIMQPSIVTLEPNEPDTKISSHKGQEFNLVTKGSIMVIWDNAEIVLNEGDSIYFDSDKPHLQKCYGDKEARFLAVIADGREEKNVTR
ncbi:MAG: cupin domain-containing protein [Oscillospiraceae bacterium]|jgi:quercetin dioxygenase-like cupin family protein|nr:cupin domain-containing protein [Oscillospiraceae bacterium]